MTGEVLAAARHRLYALLGRLLVDGADPEALALARRVPGLAEALDADDEVLAVGHHAATTEVPCAASAVLGAEGQVGGPVAEAVAEAYGRAGFLPGRRDVPLDHVGLQLAFVGHLCAVGDDARPFLDGHLLRWLPAWSVAAVRADGRWGQVARLAVELAASHRADWAEPVPAVALCGEPPALAPGLGVDEVAAMLLRPARSGWLAGRSVLVGACAAAGVAGGVGDRARGLGAALRAAGAVGRVDALVGGLVAEVERARGELEALGAGLPGLGPAVGPWGERLGRTREVLEAVRAQAGGG